MVERGEIDTRPLIRTLHEQGVEIVLPVVTSFSNGSPAMTHRRYTGDDALRPNRWGVQEPIGTDAVSPDVLDGVIVPALGAGRNGHRIGHGRGYYDAFLADLDAPTVALVYDACLVDAVPADVHDVPMSAIVTEHETLDVPVAA
jgi:5-formyltetrahydrofolate cyclo-ligase